jgi:cytoskeletal protein RodZ
MDPIEKQERKREAWRRLEAQRRRTRQLRARVVTTSIIAFVLLWGVVFAQMITGNDPVLGDPSAALASRQIRRYAGAGAGKAIPAEAEADTDSDEDSVESSAAAEAIETTDPREVEEQTLEAEPPVEAELEVVEPEPAPVTTSQS